MASASVSAVAENDDLLSEILLRLSPEPSSLPRASLVCKRWRRLLSDPAFRRRFRVHHHRRGTPPLLGFFATDRGTVAFHPALPAPDRLPRGHFSLALGAGYETLGWRHGLALFYSEASYQVLVWDPLAGARHRLDIPQGFEPDPSHNPINGAVLRGATGDDAADRFQVVLATSDGRGPARACVYSSDTGLWGDFISAELPYATMLHSAPSVLAGDRIYWLISLTTILEFDLGRQSLASTVVPPGMLHGSSQQCAVIRGEGGAMGFLDVVGFTAQLWRWETDCDGVGSWMPGRTVDLDSLLPPEPENPLMLCYAEENNVAFFWTVLGVFTFHLKSLELKRLSETGISGYHHHPFETVYTPGIGGGQEEPEPELEPEPVRRSWWKRWKQSIRGLFCLSRSAATA
ncbi:hypothetical protein ZWY2020_016103 [Hordeum vulgare]|nr:hypothetical protein ZWY2020_016103 [Hordeum vulgare]